MSYNRAVNVMGFAYHYYHYFTIRPGLFEARVFVSSDIKDCRTNHLVRQPLFYSNVYERIRTSDPSLRSSPEFCLARYHRLSNIACFQAFWMVRIACSYHCYHLIPTSLMPSLLQPCWKIQQNVKCLNKYHLSICPLSEMTANLISRQKVWNIPC